VRLSPRCCPLQRLECLRRLATRRRRRASSLSWGCLLLQRLSFRPRSTLLASGAPLLPVPLAGAGFRVFRDRTTLPSLRPERTLSWSSTPLQSTTGVHCPSGFRRLPQLTGSRRRSGPPLLRFLVPTTRCLRVPRSATIGSTDRRRRGIPLPRPVPPSGFHNPSAVSAATARRTRVAPDPPFRRRYAPKLRGLVTCRKRPWDSPSRAFPSRGAVPPRRWALLPCGFDVDPTPARRSLGCPTGFRRTPPPCLARSPP